MPSLERRDSLARLVFLPRTRRTLEAPVKEIWREKGAARAWYLGEGVGEVRRMRGRGTSW